MLEFALGLVPGSGICLYQETLYRSVSCKDRSLRDCRVGAHEVVGAHAHVGDVY